MIRGFRLQPLTGSGWHVKPEAVAVVQALATGNWQLTNANQDLHRSPDHEPRRGATGRGRAALDARRPTDGRGLWRPPGRRSSISSRRSPRADGIDWSRVEMFHLDEYVGLPIDHPASFRKYLRERLIDKAGIRDYHLLDAERDPREEAARVGPRAGEGADRRRVRRDRRERAISRSTILPPISSRTRPTSWSTLDEACRRQQVGEGWFPSLEAVPAQAVSMSIQQILKSNAIICIVPDARKAAAVKASLEGEITPSVPASILRRHWNVTVYLDRDSAALLDAATRGPVRERERRMTRRAARLLRPAGERLCRRRLQRPRARAARPSPARWIGCARPASRAACRR